jgi:uncharacterized protein YciI
MRFVVIGRDATDEGALARRAAARDAHLKGMEAGIAAGHFLMAAALLNDAGDMAGSMMLVDYPAREDLDAWLKVEPYVTGRVWNDIEIIPARVPPAFEIFLK